MWDILMKLGGAVLGRLFGGGAARSEEAGRNKERLDQHKRVDDAEDRMDDVDRGDKRSTLDRLRGSGKI